MKKRNIVTLMVFVLVVVLVTAFLSPCFLSHNYYNEPESYWHKIGASAGSGKHGLSYQTIVSGDLFGNGSLVAVSNYHHGQVGIFLHKLINGKWIRTVLHPKFTPGTSDGWPVKGLIGADIDNDGFKEIITTADIISYPIGNEKKRPFPGVIYIDLSDGKRINPQPLVWGKWGERLANDSFALLVPKILEPRFRASNNTLPDILVPTCTYVNHKHAVRIFILEQPPDGFGKYNYTFIGPNIQGSEPYDEEAFYVKHMYLINAGTQGSVVYSEMLFYPDAFQGADSVAPQGIEVMDFNNDGMMDLIVGLSYYDSASNLLGFELRFLQRVLSNNTNYAFNETKIMRFNNRGLFGIVKANLDGNASNGKESLVVGIMATTSPTQGESLFIYLTPTSDENLFEVYELAFHASVNPYRGVYNKPILLDGNKDGYDDVIFYCVDKEQPENYYPHGDVVYFQNTAGSLSGDRFIYSSQYVKVLMKGQSLTWGLTLQQADFDSELELTVCFLNPIPYWCPLYEGEINAYYCDVYMAIQ
ncbi:MAG: hypothetical protein J7L47_10625 [Candidatus Odinarchaeota archaeon]|nr:hypothetical protein [Candidatus Odinarchaeota archaeon]